MEIQGDRAEAVAYALLLSIAQHEGKTTPGGALKAEKEWVLRTYQECLRAVAHPNVDALTGKVVLSTGFQTNS